jgi:hypothetical protein
MQKILAAALALGLLSSTANAATFDADLCKSKTLGCYIITINGKIEPGDGDWFHNLVQSKNITRGLVALNSTGGEFEDGLAIANTIRAYRFTTWVGDNWTCTSACAVIWLAGSRRFYQGKAKIGFHGAYTVWKDKEGKLVKDAPVTSYNGGNALFGAFYSRLGLSEKAIVALTETAPDKMFWLNKANAAELGIAIEEWQEPKEFCSHCIY